MEEGGVNRKKSEQRGGDGGRVRRRAGEMGAGGMDRFTVTALKAGKLDLASRM
ncbi:hypothetical protein HmCmsJML006_00219 [Escherichia coli]|nr:hypothetical protein HmCmsJML006_00219 [Escherichia coli]